MDWGDCLVLVYEMIKRDLGLEKPEPKRQLEKQHNKQHILKNNRTNTNVRRK